MANTDRKFTQAAILKVLQDSYPTALKPAEIARLSGYSATAVSDNLKRMDTVMPDLRYKIPRWRPKYQYLKTEDKESK
jgi:predicted transcriptional regulator